VQRASCVCSWSRRSVWSLVSMYRVKYSVVLHKDGTVYEWLFFAFFVGDGVRNRPQCVFIPNKFDCEGTCGKGAS
jgi:hypothetical protein